MAAHLHALKLELLENGFEDKLWTQDNQDMLSLITD